MGHAFVVVGDEAQAARFKGAIADKTDLGLTVTLHIGVPAGHLAAGAFDAILIDAGADRGLALGWGVSQLGHEGAAEIVFFSDDGRAPEVAALRALRWPHLAVGPRALAWIIEALPRLVDVGRARKGLQRAQTEIPARPDDGDEPSSGLPLGIAESRFREGYVRAVLARTGNRTAAAKHAGVPYRTFCKMMRKLGVDVTGA